MHIPFYQKNRPFGENNLKLIDWYYFNASLKLTLFTHSFYIWIVNFSGISDHSDPGLLCPNERRLKATLIMTPTRNEPGIIHRKEIVIENNSCEKLIRVAATALVNVPINVAIGFGLRINIAIKKGTNSGPTNRLIVL